MLTLLHQKYPDKHYTGIDLTPKMIEVAKRKKLKGVELVVGDCENLPFAENSFDVVICCESFHHYPNPQDFFHSVYRVLRPGGRLILRDMTMSSAAVRWFCNTIEMPLAHLIGKGDVSIYGRKDIQKLCQNAGLHMESFEKRGFCRLHCVIRKPDTLATCYDLITESYHQSQGIYDDVLTQSKWWSKLYIRLFWSGVDDNEIAEKVLSYIPKDFSGSLLDVPVGTAVFTHTRYAAMPHARITGLDYSADMLAQAKQKLADQQNVRLMHGDVGHLQFPDRSFDIVLSMNGFHAFRETYRVLKRGGKFIGCYYICGESGITDTLVSKILVRKGWFTPPFDTAAKLRRRLEKVYDLIEFHVEGSMVYFCAVKR